MSWQDYVDTQLVASGQIEAAAIVGAEDGALWGQTEGFALRAYNAAIAQEDGTEQEEAVNEATNMVALMQAGQKGPQGLRMNGEKYMVVRSNPEPVTVYAKKPKGGACITKTGMCIVIGIYNEDSGHTSGGCNMVVEALGDYLRQNGC